MDPSLACPFCVLQCPCRISSTVATPGTSRQHTPQPSEVFTLPDRTVREQGGNSAPIDVRQGTDAHRARDNGRGILAPQRGGGIWKPKSGRGSGRAVARSWLYSHVRIDSGLEAVGQDARISDRDHVDLLHASTEGCHGSGIDEDDTGSDKTIIPPADIHREILDWLDSFTTESYDDGEVKDDGIDKNDAGYNSVIVPAPLEDANAVVIKAEYEDRDDSSGGCSPFSHPTHECDRCCGPRPTEDDSGGLRRSSYDAQEVAAAEQAAEIGWSGGVKDELMEYLGDDLGADGEDEAELMKWLSTDDDDDCDRDNEAEQMSIYEDDINVMRQSQDERPPNGRRNALVVDPGPLSFWTDVLGPGCRFEH